MVQFTLSSTIKLVLLLILMMQGQPSTVLMLAKMIDAPVLHVNGDDPEAVVFCVQFATEYRQKFGEDIFRRYGLLQTSWT